MTKPSDKRRDGMPKKTSTEYEAIIGGLKRQLDDAEDKYENARYNWEAYADECKNLKLMLRGTTQYGDRHEDSHTLRTKSDQDILCMPLPGGKTVVIRKGQSPWDALLEWKNRAEEFEREALKWAGEYKKLNAIAAPALRKWTSGSDNIQTTPDLFPVSPKPVDPEDPNYWDKDTDGYTTPDEGMNAWR